LVSVNLAQWFDNCSKAGMGLVAIRKGIRVAVGHEFGFTGFGGLLVLPALIQMSLMHGHGGGREAL